LDWAPRAGREHEYIDEEPNTESQDGAVITEGANFGNTNFANFTFARQAPANPLRPNVLATDAGSSIVDENGDRLVLLNEGDPVEGLRREMLARLDELEAVFRQNLSIAPNRGHNRPPEILEIERPVTQEHFQEVVAAIEEVKRESEGPTPDPENVATQVSVFRRIARFFAVGTLWLGGAIATGIIGQEAGIAYTAHKQQVFDALVSAADAVSAWVQHISLLL
jgi:hypothetical protein